MLLGLPIEKVLEDVDVSTSIREALTQGEGKPASRYQFVCCYEVGDWNRASMLAQKLGISEEDMGAVYFRCVDEVNQMWEGIISAGS